MNFRTLAPALLAVSAAFGQNCRPGTVNWDVNIQCACEKDPQSDSCKLYQRNKSMYDGKGLQPAWTPNKPDAAPAVRKAAPAVAQDSTPSGCDRNG